MHFTVRLTVCLSVCQVRALWQNEIMVCQYINTIRKRNLSSFWVQQRLLRMVTFQLKYWPKGPTSFKSRLRHVPTRSALAVTTSDRTQLHYITSGLKIACNRAVQHNRVIFGRRHRTLHHKHTKPRQLAIKLKFVHFSWFLTTSAVMYELKFMNW